MTTIRFGLSAIKGIGGGICDQIIKEREDNGKFTSLENFLSRTVEFSLNKRLIEGFISAGAFDCFGKKRSQLIAVYEKAMACAVKDAKSRIAGQFSMFGDLMSSDDAIKIDYPELNEFDHMEKLKKEKEVYKMGYEKSSLWEMFMHSNRKDLLEAPLEKILEEMEKVDHKTLERGWD